jgi:HSP20 family protein
MICNPLHLMRELAVMQDRMNRSWCAGQARGPEDATRGAWTPAVDVYQPNDSEIVVKAELPGLRREDIDVTVEQNTLTIRGQRRRDEAIAENAYRRTERNYGSFVRSFAVPAAVDGSAVRAEYRDGVLTVRLPLRGDAQAHHIEVALS